MHKPEALIVDELEEKREELAKREAASRGARILSRVERLANPSPVEKRLAWFDNRRAKAKRIVRELRDLKVDASVEGDEK